MKLLIVDDDKTQVSRYTDVIEIFNSKSSIKIEPEVHHSLESGLEALQKDFDGAVIDLRLSTNPNEARGNEIIRQIRQHKRFPICVVTGHKGDLDEEFKVQLSDQTLFFRYFQRDGSFDEPLTHLVKIHESGVLDVLGADGLIDKGLQELFWTHLAKTFTFWSRQNEPEDTRKQRLLRVSLSHLIHKLESNEDGNYDACYPDEMYIIPAIRKEWQTGDIVYRGKELALIISPSCDLATGKTKFVQTVMIESLDCSVVGQKLNQYRKNPPANATEEQAKAFQENVKEARDTILKIFSNSYSLKYHIFPKSQVFDGGVLNFQNVASVRMSEFQKSASKIGTIAYPFLKDIVARFSAYYARQGQPNFESEKLLKDLLV